MGPLWYTGKKTVRYALQDKLKETLLIREFKPTLNDEVSSEKLYLYYFAASDMQMCFSVSVIVIVN